MEGKNRVNYVDETGDVTHGTAPSYDFLYRQSTVKDPEWNLGDRVVLPDGREFRYAKSGAACVNGYACNFNYTGHQAYTALGISVVVGDSEITIPAGTHDAVTEDELRGGYVIVFQGGADLYTTVRQIIGNDASAADLAYKVRLDASLTYAYVAGTAAVEVYANPWADVRYSAGYAIAGVPTVYVSAASKYFWVQTKGIAWVGSAAYCGGNTADGWGQYGCFWGTNGSLVGPDTALATTVPSGSTSQYAGVTVTGSNAGNGPLLDMK